MNQLDRRLFIDAETWNRATVSSEHENFFREKQYSVPINIQFWFSQCILFVFLAFLLLKTDTNAKREKNISHRRWTAYLTPSPLSALSIRRTWQWIEYRIEIVFDSTIYCELPVDISLEAKSNLFLEISERIYVFACSMHSARSQGQRGEDAKEGENRTKLFINEKYFHISVHSMRVSRSLCTACEATAHRCANQKVIIYVCWLTTSTKEINKNHISNLHTEHSRCAGWHTHIVHHRPYHHRQHPPIYETAREILENARRAENGGETTPWRSIHDRWLQRSISFHTISVRLPLMKLARDAFMI